MKLAIFALVFAIMIAASALADGLKITEIDFHVDYDEAYTYRVENRDKKDSGLVNPANNSKIDADVFPGANLSFTVRIENTFSSSGPDIKGVFARMTIEEIDDGADLEYESLDFDLEPGDDYRYDLKFEMPLDADSGTYTAFLEAEGDDRNGTVHNTEIILKLEIKRQNHDIRIIKSSIDTGIVQCDRQIKLSAGIMNLGRNLENDVSLEFKSQDLGISTRDNGILLESSDESSIEDRIYTKDAAITVSNSIKAGIYPIDVNLYWREIVLFDKKNVYLLVRDCGNGQPIPGTLQNNQVEIIQDGPENAQEPYVQLNGQTDSGENSGLMASITSSPSLVLIILGGFIAFVLAIVAIFGYTSKK